jgi:hypothetical protein
LYGNNLYGVKEENKKSYQIAEKSVNQIKKGILN